jgi:sideroflexin-5
MSNETLMLSYSAAVGSALMVAFGLATLIQTKFSPSKAQQLMKFVAFPSAVVASSLNCYIVRSPEIESGIPLLDEHYQPILVAETTTSTTTTTTTTTMVPATSQVAAQQGVYSTTLSRAMLQAPVYFLPPLLVGLGPLKQLLVKHPTYKIPLTTTLLLLSFGLGLPATIAMVPQMATIDASQVEPQFQQLQNPTTGKPYAVYYYNKGL